MNSKLSKENIPTWLGKLPNQLTIARMAIVPFLLLLYPLDFKFLTVVCGLLFCLAAATDFFDGFLARQYGLHSKIGEILDPIADKILSAAGLILLVGTGRLAAFLGGLLLCRDIILSGLRAVAAMDGMQLKVNHFGKVKTFFQSIGISLLLIHYPLFGLPLKEIGMVMIWIALFFSFYSAYLYVQQFTAGFTRSETTATQIKS